MSEFNEALGDDDLASWDELLENHYGRPLTQVELKHEADLLHGLPMTAAESEDELHSQAGWMELKAGLIQREFEIAQREKKVAEDLYGELLSPPMSDDGTADDGEFFAWVDRINEIIRTRLEAGSLFELMEMCAANDVSQKALRMALKRHSENHAMKADVFTWLDTNMPNFKSMDAAAQAVTKQQPIAFRTARDWVGEWKKVRSTGTP